MSTEQDLNGSQGDRFEARGGHHMESLLDSIGGSGRGPGRGIIESIIDSIQNGPPRMGHPANPRGFSPFGSDDSESPFGRGGPSLSDIFDDDDLDQIFGKGQVRVMAIGPDGPHMLHQGEARFSDVLALQDGRDTLGLGDMLKNYIENPPSRNERKLSLLSLIDKELPLTLKLYTYAGHAGAEIARFLRDPEENRDFAFVRHLAGVLAKAKVEDKETFGNLQRRLKEYSVDLPGLIAKIQAFVDKPSVNTAKSVQMRLAVAAPVALALPDDVSEDLKHTREKFAEKLRRTSQI